MATLQQITTKAKTIYKKGKAGVSWRDSISQASKALSGVKSKSPAKKVSGVGKVKRTRSANVRVGSSNTAAKPRPVMGKIGAVQRGESVMKEITKLEGKLSETKDPSMRKFYVKAINAQHDKLDAMTKKL